jgi:hypothetical protein
MAAARQECERRLDAGAPLCAVEQYIDTVAVSADARAALWLWAWTWGERRSTNQPSLRQRARAGRRRFA